MRSDHLSAGPPNTITPSTGNSDTVAVEALARAARFVPARIASSFGNLPAATQLHLLEPFLSDDRGLQKGDLHATTHVVGDRYEERYTGYLFNARWMAFVAAHRSVPYQSGMTGPELWGDSLESAAIRTTPWVVAAWFGPVARPRHGLAAR